jgi:tetraacyldisaccharide 4'-kinase
MISILAACWRTCADGGRAGVTGRLLLGLLVPISFPYVLIQHLRAALYRTGLLKSRRLPRPVISVGNITVGGTGKTPVTAFIARLLLAQGARVAVLSRGYGGTREGDTAIVSNGREIFLTPHECGDEPYLIATTVPGLMVVMGSDRYRAGMMALEQLSPDIFLLDDGFQHLRLHRDLNILLLDSARPFGNGWTLPAGLLREPAGAARRADLVIRTRCEPEVPVTPVSLDRPTCIASHRIIELTPLAGGPPLAPEALQGEQIIAFAGIATPEQFFSGLAAQGLRLTATVAFPDHAVYDEPRIGVITAALTQAGEHAWAVTTEKDGVKLSALPHGLAGRILLARLEVALHDPAPLEALLYNLLQK